MGPAPQIFSRSKNALRPHCQRMNGLLQPSNWREQSCGLSRRLGAVPRPKQAHDKRRFRLVNNERWRLLAIILNDDAARRERRYHRGASKARFPS